LGTSTSKEGKAYFQSLDKHKKDFIWMDEQDGDAIELAFSKKKIEARKNWLRQYEVGFSAYLLLNLFCTPFPARRKCLMHETTVF
jgi:hypothetical protein